MYAVLEDGLKCYLKNMDSKSRRGRILFFEVRNWMKAKDYGPFSFEMLCQEFGMKSSPVRNALEGRLALAQAPKAKDCGRDAHEFGPASKTSLNGIRGPH